MYNWACYIRQLRIYSFLLMRCVIQEIWRLYMVVYHNMRGGPENAVDML